LDIGERIRSLIQQSGMTYDQVAAACIRNGHPMSKSHLSQLINGGRKPTFGTLEKIADAVGVPLEEWIGARWDDTGETIKHTVVQSAGPSVTIPLYDLTVSAGRFCCASSAPETVSEYLTLPRAICPDPTACCVRVSGQSMIERGVCDGDIVIVSQRHQPKSGDMAIVCIDDETISLKVVTMPAGDDEHYVLKSANSDAKKFPDRIVKRSAVTRMLRVMHIYRSV